jgi:hypothetical protein
MMRELTDREFDLLCTAADARGFVSLEEFAAAILPTCPGPRTAKRYASESAWSLVRAGLLRSRERVHLGCAYQITPLGRQYLRCPAWLADRLVSKQEADRP